MTAASTPTPGRASGSAQRRARLTQSLGRERQGLEVGEHRDLPPVPHHPRRGCTTGTDQLPVPASRRQVLAAVDAAPEAALLLSSLRQSP